MYKALKSLILRHFTGGSGYLSLEKAPLLTAIGVVLLVGSPVWAQDTLAKKNDIVRLAEGVAGSYAAPFHWKQKQWLTAGAVVAGTAGFMLIDEPVRDFWVRRNSTAWDVVERVGFHYGKPYTGFTTIGLLYVPGLIFKNEWMRETGLALGIGMFSSGILQTFLKTAVGRSRPAAERGAFAYHPFTSEISYHAFPGGHITVATAVSYILARRIKSVPVKVALYSLAASTLLSRLYSDSHWLSDEVFGAAMTVAFSEAAIRYVERSGRRKEGFSSSLRLVPGSRGASLIFKF